MDKTEYETYEYLPTTYANEEGASQLLVVQEDGTFLCFDRPVQYVTEVDEVKGVLEGVQGCDVYDVTPQQLYIDGNNSSELISVPDQLILLDGEESEKKYLIHDDDDSKQIPMEQDEGDICKEVTANEETVIEDTDVESAADKNTDDCTEITLNDDQYQLLEQKGWILLESTDKTFLLDSSGLHDITADEKLFNKLKSELQEDLEDESRSINIKDEYVQNRRFEIKSENTEPEVENVVEDDMVNYVIEDTGIIEEQESKVEHVSGTLGTVTEEVMKEEYSGQADIISPIKAEHDYVKVTSVKDSYVKKQNDTIKIKTKFSFKDIPPEVVLGKFNGKRLIARVVKSVRPVRKLGTSVPNAQIPRINRTGFAGLDDSKFENLIREAVRGAVVYGVKDVTAAEIVVGQLSRVPAFRAAVMERGLIITKVIIQEHETGELYSESSPSLVTGRAVRERDNFNNCRFKFIPEMLRKLAYTEEYNDEDGESDHYDFLHIHIRETKSTDGIIRISITLNKRHIPLNLLTDDNNAEHPNTIYACIKCASVYNTLEGLQIHEETECMATNTKKTSIEGEAKKAYRVINASRGKQYACNLCNIAYTKLVNCQEHIKRHFKQDSVSDGGKSSQQIVVTSVENKKRTLKLADVQKGHRCNMCNRAFLDASSLSRHIITRHIQHVIDVN